jgi:putative tryptophan/tyrosine transport system substrate-binding protein
MWYSAVGFTVTLTLSLLAAPLTVKAQPRSAIPRIGILTPATEASTPLWEAFRQGLRDLGYVEGKTIALEYRFAAGRLERLPELAAELVRLKVDILVTDGGAAARAAKDTTATIPIIMAVVGDAVRYGLVTSLARPGGNVTGFSIMVPELSGKRLELLKETMPHVSRVAVLWNAGNLNRPDQLPEIEATARVLGIQLSPHEFWNPDELDSVFAAMRREGAEALLTLADAVLWNHRTRVVELAAQHQLPAMCPEREFAEAGGLMAYGPSVLDNFRRTAVYVDKILKGAQPANLPVEQPRKFELVINLKIAKALGVTIPPALLFRADEVIQ